MSADLSAIARPGYLVGDLEIDTGRQAVSRDGHEVALPKLSYDLLIALVESAPDVVSNQSLMKRVWPGLVVSERTVTQRVKLLRDALGDDPQEPRYIVGLRGRGYRIAPAVTRIPGDDIRSTAAVDPTRDATISAARQPSPTLVRIAVAIALVLTVVLAVMLLRSPSVDRKSNGPVLNHSDLEKVDRSVAVLPFRNLSIDANDSYLALGFPDMIIDRLATVSGLLVISESSSAKAFERNLNAREVGRQLGVRYLINGSVQRTGEMLRVSAQLVDATSDTHLWSLHIDRPISEIFSLQDEMGNRIAAALKEVIVSLGEVSPSRIGTTNLEAYLSFLKGRTLLARWTVVDAKAAAAAFEKAIALDPDFAPAYAMLYDARLLAADRGSGGAGTLHPNSASRVAAMAAARSANQYLIDKALDLDPLSGAAFFARAMWSSDDKTRADDFKRGMELDPRNGRGLTAFAEYLDSEGRRDEASEVLSKAMRIDPLSPRAYYWDAMRSLEYEGREGVERRLQRLFEIDPDYQPALQRYAKYRWIGHGEFAEAIELIEHAIRVDSQSPWSIYTATAIYVDIGDMASARALNSGPESGATAGQLLLALRDGDRRRAGEAAFSDAVFDFGCCEIWGVYEAARDWATSSEERLKAIAWMQRHTHLESLDADITLTNFRAVPALADLLMQENREAEARRLLERCIGWIDDYHVPTLGTVFALRVKADALLLLGEKEAALDVLQAAFDAHDYQQWWYTLESNERWRPLHSDPRFMKISESVSAHIDAQRVALDELRQRGAIPDRRGS